MVEFTCPSCGAPHTIRNPGVVKAVCEYCGNAVIWDEQRIRDAGKQATLPEGFTRLYRGATGRLLGKRFEVLGRVRYGFGGGFWDEWFLTLADGRTGWLTEDNHELALQQPVPVSRANLPQQGSLTDRREMPASGAGLPRQGGGSLRHTHEPARWLRSAFHWLYGLA